MKLGKRDFERLTDSQMEWAGNDGWVEQTDRFEDNINWSHKFIYWTENYASTLLATEYLNQNGYDYSISYDGAMECYCFTTDYSSSWFKSEVNQ
jgi:hypothetical protein